MPPNQDHRTIKTIKPAIPSSPIVITVDGHKNRPLREREKSVVVVSGVGSPAKAGAECESGRAGAICVDACRRLIGTLEVKQI